MNDRRFGPQSTQCLLCDGTCPSMDGPLCNQWKAAQAIRYTPDAWRFAEYTPGHFALYDHRLNVVLMTRDFSDMLSPYRARPPWVPPVRKAPAPIIDLSKLEIKL